MHGCERLEHRMMRIMVLFTRQVKQEDMMELACDSATPFPARAYAVKDSNFAMACNSLTTDQPLPHPGTGQMLLARL
eukprot:1156156-Pelagomonas_calceolata.AAC.3